MCGSLFHAVKDVAVDVQSGLHIGGSQVVLQSLDIHSAFDTSGGVGVTQIMKPGILAAHLFNDAFVTVIHCTIGQFVSCCIGKHQIVLLPAAGPCRLTHSVHDAASFWRQSPVMIALPVLSYLHAVKIKL